MKCSDDLCGWTWDDPGWEMTGRVCEPLVGHHGTAHGAQIIALDPDRPLINGWLNDWPLWGSGLVIDGRASVEADLQQMADHLRDHHPELYSRITWSNASPPRDPHGC